MMGLWLGGRGVGWVVGGGNQEEQGQAAKFVLCQAIEQCFSNLSTHQHER